MGRPRIPPGGQGEVPYTEIRRGKWLARVAWVDRHGTKHRSRGRGETKRDALAHLDEVVAAGRAATDVDESSLTLGTIARRWLSDLPASRPGIGDSTIAQYAATWHCTLAPVMADRPAEWATRRNVQEALMVSSDATTAGSWFSTRTEARSRSGARRPVPRMMLAWAADRGLIETDPLLGTRSAPCPAPKKATITDDQWTRLLQLLADDALPRHNCNTHDFLLLMRRTGVRIGEAAGLTCGDVELGGDVPRARFKYGLRETRGGVGGRGLNKSRPSFWVTLHPDVETMLRSRRLAAVAHGGGWAKKYAPVFMTRNGRFTEQPHLRSVNRRVTAGTELEGFTSHALRRTFLTQAERVYGEDAASQMANHSDVGTTRRHYIVVDEERVIDPRALWAGNADATTAGTGSDTGSGA